MINKSEFKKNVFSRRTGVSLLFPSVFAVNEKNLFFLDNIKRNCEGVKNTISLRKSGLAVPKEKAELLRPVGDFFLGESKQKRKQKKLKSIMHSLGEKPSVGSFPFLFTYKSFTYKSFTYKSFTYKSLLDQKKLLKSSVCNSKKGSQLEKNPIVKRTLKKEEYLLETFKRSNQDTCLTHKPNVLEGNWVQTGDLLTDCASSVGGELSLGQNLFIAYMPWEGYNFEDAILISERLVMDDLYTSIHIERYELETQQTKMGVEEITRNIPDVSEKEIEKLDSFGIVKLGSWVEEGDILVGKITPINKKKISPYQKLLYTILEKQVRPIKDSSLRAPKGIKAKVIDIKYFLKSSPYAAKSTLSIPDSSAVDKKKSFKSKQQQLAIANLKPVPTGNNISSYRKGLKPQPMLHSETNLVRRESSFLLGFPKGRKKGKEGNRKDSYREQQSAIKKSFLKKINLTFLKTLPFASRYVNQNARSNNSFNIRFTLFRSRFYDSFLPNQNMDGDSSSSQYVQAKGLHYVQRKGKETRVGIEVIKALKQKTKFKQIKKATTIKNIETIHIYLAEKRKIQVGDKMAGRHGNKGIISNILPIQDMPFLPDGTPIDMVLNPLGVPSRMNVGQIYECLLGLAGKYLGENYKVYSFDEIYGPEASRSFVFNKLYEARTKTGFKWLFDPNSPGKIRLFDGRTGECFDQKVTVGLAYMLRLVHMVDDKLHARSTGPYSLVTQQPLRGRSKQGGQRLGEMEVWALEGYGAAFTLLEMLTIKSDDMTGRMALWSNLILNKDISIGTPESFKVLICELQALCLDIGLFRNLPLEKADKSHPIETNKSGNLREIQNLMNLP